MIREEQYFHYIVSSRLGVGSFGEVCKVKRLTDGRSFALKTLKDGIVKRNPRILQMLNHEVSGLLGKYHPNMVTMHDAFTIKGDFFLIYEICEPQSLKTRLKQGAVWDEHNVVELAKGMVKVLHYLHGLGILHRDIKPDNILVKDDEYKLADFGLCYRGGSHYDNDLIGSPAYLAPEIFKKRYYSEKSDIYALGISLYELYIGRYPFDQKNEAALYKKKMEFVPGRDNMPTASDKFIVLLRMMCHPVENKRATIDELVTALDIRFDTVNAAIQNHVSEFGETPKQQGGHYEASQYNHQLGQGAQQQPHSAYDHAGYQDTNQLQQPSAHVEQYTAPVSSMQNNNLVQQDFAVVHAAGNQDKLKVGYYDPWAVTPTTSAPTSNTGSFSNEIPANGFAPQSNYNNLFDEHMMRRVPYKNQPFVASPDGIRGQQRSEHRQDLAHATSPQLLAPEDYSHGFLAHNKRGRDFARDENTKPASGLNLDIYAREPTHQMHRAYTLEERAHKPHERSQSSHPQQKRFISSNRMNIDALIQQAPSQQNHQNYGVHRPAFEPIAMNHRRDLLAIPGIGIPDARSGSRPRLAPEAAEDQSPNSAKKFSRYLRANEELAQPTSSNNRTDLPFLPQTRTVTAQPQGGHFQFPESGVPQPAVQRGSNFVGSFRTLMPSPHQQGSFQLTDQTSPSPVISPMRNSPTYATPVGGHPQFFQQKILQLQPVPAPTTPDSRYVNAEAQNILNEINTFTEHIQPQRQRARQIFDEYHQGQPQGRRYN